jgi:hypothetical protein
MLDRTVEAGPPIAELDIRRFERDAKLILPPDYQAFLLKHNGGRPVPAGFQLNLDGEPYLGVFTSSSD